MTSSSTARLACTTAVIALALSGCGSWLAGRSTQGTDPAASADEGQGDGSGAPQNQLTTVRLFVMSKCPHCSSLLESLIPIARGLSHRLRLSVDYVGGVVDGELASPHGEGELIGDMVELCAHEHAPYERWLGFVECLHHGDRWIQIPEGWEDCGRQAEIDVRAVDRCVRGDEGAELLAGSFTRTAEAGVDAAPTLLAGDIVVVGNRSADVIAEVICSLFQEPLPSLCESVDPLPYVPVTFVTDERCHDARCDVSSLEKSIRSLVWGAEVTRMTYQSEPGAALFRSAGLKHLPAVVIGSQLLDDREGYKSLRHLRRSGDYFVRTLGRFDPIKGSWSPPLPVKATVLNDRRCPADQCTTEELEEALDDVLETVTIDHADYSEDAGKALFKRIRPAVADGLTLPAVVFSKAVSDDEEFVGQLGKALVPADDEFVLVVGRWDPTVELCDNAIDDDGDGLVDCRDSDCEGQWTCRPAKQRRLELFAMSHCPFAAKVMEALPTVVDHFGRQPSKLDLRVHFIGSVTDDGTLESMHGPSEVEEDLRQVCAQQHYRSSHAFVDYLACRARAPLDDDWESCVRRPLSADVIRRCAEGPEGQRLLRESYSFAESLGVSGSPSWLLNNRFEMSGRTARAIVEGFCEHNELPECNREVDEPEVDEEPEGGCGGER